MQLPIALGPSLFATMPPLHAWPSPIKRTLLTFAVVVVSIAYMALGGGIIAFLAVLARWISG